jgi:uncharacterized protein YjiK
MITKTDKILFSIIGIVVMLTFIFWTDVKSFAGIKAEPENSRKVTSMKKGKKNKDEQRGHSVYDVSIIQKWELPAELKEISGIAYIDEQRFACIQDEKGTIYIFNIRSNKIEKEISFAGAGDFEGITVKGNFAYAVRADGKIYEVDMNVGKNSAQEFSTSLTLEHNVEGLCYDQKNNRLLLAIKDEEPGNPGYKGIYAFDLSKKSFVQEPVFKISMQDDVIATSKGKKDKPVMPSAIAINPLTSEIFITDGPKSNLLILDPSGKTKKLVQLGQDFAQPEGITFSPQGDIFISNEGNKQAGNILKVELK